MRLTVDGAQYEVDVEGDMPLLWVLREELGLTSVKYGCGIAQCGACTVHVDGVAMRSCQLPADSLEGAEVTTLDGLAPGGALHALQEAWIALQVSQCGYCQAGQMMQAADLLARKQEPTDRDIDDAMGGNLCRCGTYPRIRAAIHDAAARLREG